MGALATGMPVDRVFFFEDKAEAKAPAAPAAATAVTRIVAVQREEIAALEAEAASGSSAVPLRSIVWATAWLCISEGGSGKSARPVRCASNRPP